MGALTKAGILSGLGQGLMAGLSEAQKQMGQQNIEKIRQEYEEIRLNKNIEAASNLQKSSQAFEKGERGLDRQQRTDEAFDSRAHAEALQTGQQTFMKGENEAGRGQAETFHKDTMQAGKELRADNKQIAKDHNEMQKQIHDSTNKTNLLLGELQRASAKGASLASGMSSLGSEITRLSAIVEQLAVDKSGPTYKATVIELERAQKYHQIYAEQLAGASGVSADKIRQAKPIDTLPEISATDWAEARRRFPEMPTKALAQKLIQEKGVRPPSHVEY